MHIDHVETWDSLADSLLRYGLVSTKSSDYEDTDKFIKHLLDGMSTSLRKQFKDKKPIFVGVNEEYRDPRGKPYFVFQLKDRFTNNEEAKELLEHEY